VVVDIGTGDGRAVLARAAAEPRSLVIGIDANAAVMAEASRRAFRGHAPLRVANAWFMVEAAETLPGPLPRVAALVTITMPWGSLLRGVLGLDGALLRGIASIVAPAGRVEVVVSIAPSDNIDGFDGINGLDERAMAQIVRAWRGVGFELVALGQANAADFRTTRSSWARRLGHRPVWRLEFVRGPRGASSASRSRPRCATLTLNDSTPAHRPRAGRQRRTYERGQGDDAPAR
jgi:16S rRNA (adenine(1408)-N(1))-methyltransferase